MKIPATVLFTFLLYSVPVLSQVINLNGDWKFHIDDNTAWSSKKFDDSHWETIQVPSSWEDQGFYGYDGFAWYRKKFDGRELDKQESYTLHLGYIDDADEVYVNSKLIGFSGSMPPKFKTAYNTERYYALTEDLINFEGENTIAIRVFDSVLGGGIMAGDLGIFKSKKSRFMLMDLQGIWSFATSRQGDPIRKESDWKNIMVPGAWEYRGYPRYDGLAWYKRTFVIPANFTDEPLVLLMGKIDDFDGVYLNGKLIGSTNDHRPLGRSQAYKKDRAYPIPTGALNRNGINTIEVLVIDLGGEGGIYEGPIGIASKASYERYHQ